MAYTSAMGSLERTAPNTSVIDVPYHLGDTEDFEAH